MKALLLSDIHGNWSALQAVLHAEPDSTQIICLGDLVNYGPQPVECVVWAMRLTAPSLVIQGNHDRAFGLGTSPNCAPAHQHLAEAVQAATSPLLTPEMRRFLAELQPLQQFRLGDAACFACHTRPGDLRCSNSDQNGQNWGESESEQGTTPASRPNPQWPWESDIMLIGLPGKAFTLLGHPNLVFLGHTHTPMKTDLWGTLVINPGSVGKPLDGDPHAAYALWEDGMVTFRRVAYDVEETVRAFESLALNDTIKCQLADELRTGGRTPAYPPAEMAIGR